MAARKPAHIPHPQSEAYQLDQRGWWREQEGEAVARLPAGLAASALPPQRGSYAGAPCSSSAASSSEMRPCWATKASMRSNETSAS